MPDKQQSPGQTAFEKAARGEGLTEAESHALAASHGLVIPPTVLDKTGETANTTREQAQQVMGGVQPDKNPEKEERLEKKIAQIESAFTAFERTFIPLVERSVHNPELRVALANPFHIINANRANPLKNFEKAKKEAQASGLPVEALMLLLPNPRHFAYSIEPQLLAEHGAMVGCAPIQRMLGISPAWDPENALDRFGIYHETVHIMHQAMQRMRNMESFIAFYAGQNRRVIIDEEYDAYALELEALNVQLGETLRRTIAAGQGFKSNIIMQSLQLQENQCLPATHLAWLAAAYFPHGTIRRYPEAFRERVDQTYLHDGYNLFRYGTNGRPVPYKSR